MSVRCHARQIAADGNLPQEWRPGMSASEPGMSASSGRASGTLEKGWMRGQTGGVQEDVRG
jgi:hypothetical protein